LDHRRATKPTSNYSSTQLTFLPSNQVSPRPIPLHPTPSPTTTDVCTSNANNNCHYDFSFVRNFSIVSLINSITLTNQSLIIGVIPATPQPKNKCYYGLY
jgi:hypothetical protein